MLRQDLRKWQSEALAAWEDNCYRGIIGAVTGGGKTIFALACIAKVKPETSLIVVPTLALLDQWWSEAAAYFNLRLDDINIISSRGKLVHGTINIGVLNTVSKWADRIFPRDFMLVIDECHKAASSVYSRVLEIPASATLGLSATPERPYDNGLDETLIPALGPVLFQYNYKDAMRDGVIVPFHLVNIVFDLEEDRQQQYQRLTRAIARTIDGHGPDSPEAVALYLRRSRVLNLSERRVELTLRIIASHQGERTIVFHEDIEACNVIGEVLQRLSIKSGVYHSAMPVRNRAEMLANFRSGQIDVLVTCRALDEGFNVPEARVGIIAASTATRRQRIQRLGRVLRPASNKEGAMVYTLVASDPEIARLKSEEAEMEGVANVAWRRA